MATSGLAGPEITEGLLITYEDAAPLFVRSKLSPSGYSIFDSPTTGLPPVILSKLTDSAPLLLRPHNIDPETYTTVFLTSDIHADLEKFMFILYNMGIINTYYTTHPDNSSSSQYVKTPGQILGFITKFKLKFSPETKFLLVIIGDLVDGRRVVDSRGGGYHIDDKFGNIEVLLHIFIYNLRIKARMQGSEVLFTIGNHDWHTVINNDLRSTIYNNYVHTTAKNFFGDDGFRKSFGFTNRRNTLLPFYRLSPYIVITLGRELICVHGGLHNTVGNMTDDVIALQTEIDVNGLIETLLQETSRRFLTSESVEASSPIWTRFYAEKTEGEVCGSIDDRFFLTAVGHCPTDSYTGQAGYMSQLEAEDRGRCGSSGCLLFGCKTENAPKLAFVDISMSRIFRRGVSDKYRSNEILVLKHDPSPTFQGERYYNTIINARSLISGNFQLVWQQQAFANEPFNVLPTPTDLPPGPPAVGPEEHSNTPGATAPQLKNPYNKGTNYNRWAEWELGQAGGKRKKTRRHKKRARRSRKVLRRK